MKYRTFQPQFIDAIRSGIKISTIRGKPWAKVGERVALRYWKGAPYRSQMGTIGTAVVDQIADITLGTRIISEPELGAFERKTHELLTTWGFVIHINGQHIGRDQTEALAIQEGFNSARMMGLWFMHNHQIKRRTIACTLTRWSPASLEIAP